MDSLLDTKIITHIKMPKSMLVTTDKNIANFITLFQSLIAAIGIMIIVLLMGIESKIDKLLNKK